MSASKWKPYPNYKSIEGVLGINKIPENWVLRSFKHYYSCSMGATILATDLIENGKIPVFSATEGDDYFGFVNSSRVLLEKGDLVIPARGNSIGNPKLVSSTSTCTQTTIFCKKISNIYDEFVYCFLIGCKDILFNFVQTAIPQITVDEVKNNFLLVPPKVEQEEISKFIHDKRKIIDKKISQLEKSILLLNEKLSAIITQAVTKGLNLSGPIKEINSAWIDSIPEDWTNLRIKQIVSTKVTDGPHVTPVQVDEGIPFLSATAVENGKLNINKMWGYISREDHELYCRKCLPQLEDIFIVKSGATTGSIAFLDFEDEFSVWSPLALIRCDRNKMHPRFVFYSLQSDYLQQAISQTWSKGTQENIAMKAIEELPILRPPLEEQIEIANYIDVSKNLVDELISKTNTMIKKLKQYRTSLIFAIVTGQIDVRSL